MDAINAAHETEKELLAYVQKCLPEVGNDSVGIRFSIVDNRDSLERLMYQSVGFIQFVDSAQNVIAHITPLDTSSSDFDDLAAALLELASKAGNYTLYKTGNGWGWGQQS